MSNTVHLVTSCKCLTCGWRARLLQGWNCASFSLWIINPMSPYWRYQLQICPATGFCDMSREISFLAGDEIGEHAKSSSKPESLNLDTSFCFLFRAVWRCWASVRVSGEGEATFIRLLLKTLSKPPSQFSKDTISSVWLEPVCTHAVRPATAYLGYWEQCVHSSSLLDAGFWI